jgi:hypothetical protein
VACIRYPTCGLWLESSGLTFALIRCICMFQVFQMYDAIILFRCCKSRSGNVTHIAYVAIVSETCCKRLFKNVLSVSRCLLQSFLSRCCICFTYISRQYIPNVSTVSILGCSKWFHVASCKSGRFMCFTHMLQVRVLNVSSTFQTYVAFKYFSCCRYTYMIYI